MRLRGARTAAAVIASLGLAACAPRQPAPGGGPVVLITLEGLRADAVSGLGGQPGLTPNLAALIREADWAGTAIAPSSWGVPAMATLFTGLSPWQHHAVLDGDNAHLALDLITLPKAFKTIGYRTAGFTSGHWYSAAFGYDRGFDSFDEVGRNRDAADFLAALEDGKQLVWVQVPEPQAPYRRRNWLLPRLGGGRPSAGGANGAGGPGNAGGAGGAGGPGNAGGAGGAGGPGKAGGDLPPSVEALDLLAASNPEVPPTPALRRRFTAMYRLNVAWADERAGRLLDALRASGQWDRALVVVTSAFGEELGEHGAFGHGGDLERESLEVPLIVKLPSWCRRRLLPSGPAGRQRIALARLWATLIEAAGGEPAPATAPSLFRTASDGVLSELYLGNGTNLYSLVEGDDQLLWLARFGAPEPGLYRASLAAQAGTEGAAHETFGVIAARLFDGFAATPPLAGLGPPELALARWAPGGGSRRFADPRRAAVLAGRLAARWHEFLPEELTPEQEDLEWLDQLPPPAPEAPEAAAGTAGSGGPSGSPTGGP